MYSGIGENWGKEIKDEDAFSYVCEQISEEPVEEQANFMYIANNSETLQRFMKETVEWYYSGGWVHEEEV